MCFNNKLLSAYVITDFFQLSNSLKSPVWARLWLILLLYHFSLSTSCRLFLLLSLWLWFSSHGSLSPLFPFSVLIFNTWFSPFQDSHRFGAQISQALQDIMTVLSADAKSSSSAKGTAPPQPKKLAWMWQKASRRVGKRPPWQKRI